MEVDWVGFGPKLKILSVLSVTSSKSSKSPKYKKKLKSRYQHAVSFKVSQIENESGKVIIKLTKL